MPIPGFTDPYSAWFIQQGMEPPPPTLGTDVAGNYFWEPQRDVARGRAAAESATPGSRPQRGAVPGTAGATPSRREAWGGGSREAVAKDSASRRLEQLATAQRVSRQAAQQRLREQAAIEKSKAAGPLPQNKVVAGTQAAQAREREAGRLEAGRQSALARERTRQAELARAAKEAKEAALQQAAAQARNRVSGSAVYSMSPRVQQANARNAGALAARTQVIATARKNGLKGNTAAAAHNRREQAEINRSQREIADFNQFKGTVDTSPTSGGKLVYTPEGWDVKEMGVLSQQRVNLGARMGPLGVEKMFGRAQYGGRDAFDMGRTLTPEQIKAKQRQLRAAGYLSDAEFAAIQGKGQVGVWGYETAMATRKAMSHANAMFVDLDTALGYWAGQGMPGQDMSGGGGGGGRGSGPTSSTTVSKNIRLTSLDSGSLALRQWMTREMGRVPSDAEVRAYVARLNAKERANPDIITTTVNTNASGTSTTSQKIEEGKAPEPEAEANRYGAEDPGVKVERENFKRASYMGDIMAMLGVR